MTDLHLVSDPPPRTRNVTASESCDWCDDTGFVVYATRIDRWNGRAVEQEELAPCPHCERGFAVEFPDPAARIQPPWDPVAGFWRGRSSAEIRPLVDTTENAA